MNNGQDKADQHEESETLKMLWSLGGGIFLTLAFWLASKQKFIDIYGVDRTHFYLSSVLALSTLALFFLWAISTHKELRILARYLSESDAPPLGYQPYAAIFVIALFLAFLINFSENILFYSGMMTVFCMVNIWGESLVRLKVKAPLDISLKEQPGTKPHSIATEFQKFYFNKPHFPKLATSMLLYCIGFVIALMYYYNHSINFRNWAYLIVIVNIVASEIVIWLWRKNFYAFFSNLKKSIK